MHSYEAEVLPGLEPFARREIAGRFRKDARVAPTGPEGEVRFTYSGAERQLLALRTVVSVYRVLDFDVPRPKALLGHEHLSRLLTEIDEVLSLQGRRAFKTFRFSAAGSDTVVFDRLRDAVGEHTRLAVNPEEADFLLRVRPTPAGEGWQVLLRLTPRPLATRPWRLCDWPGALNATIAAVMVELSDPRAKDRVLNPMCGSGTLLIERLARRPAALAYGADTDQEALYCAQENIIAAGMARMIQLAQMDATALDVPDGSFDVLFADLPWGQLSGSHRENEWLYPAALAEWGRVAAPGARLVAITHEIALMDDVLPTVDHLWELSEQLTVYQGGLHPSIYLFERKDS